MSEGKVAGFMDFFKSIPDHRIERHKRYSVEEILLLTFCALIAGCDSWNDIELFGQTKLDYLRGYLPYTNGVPSDDTLRRFFRALDPEIFEGCFHDWVCSFQTALNGRFIAVDGKTSRRTFDSYSRPMHLISAFVSELGITLGQLATADKSNEITAIPELLDLLDIAGATVTLDAMGCQTNIARHITDKGAHYVIGLKGNQGRLNEDVRLFFNNKPKEAVFHQSTDVDKGHGRIETRQCTITGDTDWLTERHPKWANLNSIIEIESQRDINGETTTEKRYYISSLPADAQQAAQAIRQHWGIENNLHWVLDVVFGDDQSRIRKGNAPRNMAIIKKTVLNLLKNIKKDKPRVSLKAMRKWAGWDENFLDSVLNTQF